MLEFAEETLDEVAIAVEERAERRDALAVRHGLDAGPCAAFGQGRAHGVAVIGAVAEQDTALAKAVEPVAGAAPVMRLSFGQFEQDRQTERIDQCMDLGGQPAARAIHATGSAIFFLALPACWCTRIDELSILWISPS